MYRAYVMNALLVIIIYVCCPIRLILRAYLIEFSNERKSTKKDSGLQEIIV